MRAVIILAAGAALLSGCEERVRIPDGPPGACWHVSTLDDGTVRFNPLPDPQPNLENCAARLEEMRVRFLRLGGNRRQVVGAYGNQFLFVDGAGVSLSRSLDGGRFVALRRTPDGRLAIPGAFEVERGEPAEPAGGGEG